MNTVRDSLLSLIILAAVLLCSTVPLLQAEPSTDVSAGSFTQNMNSTRRLTNTDATADRQITSAGNCRMRGSVAGVSGISSGMNMSAAGTRNAIGTSTTMTR